jgi:hypothetical protein
MNISKCLIHFYFDTSETEHIILTTFIKGILESSVPYNELPQWFTKYLPGPAAQINP